MLGLSPDFTHKVKADRALQCRLHDSVVLGIWMRKGDRGRDATDKKYCHEQTKACSKTGSNG